MSKTPKTDAIKLAYGNAPDPCPKGFMHRYADLARAMESAGNALYECLEHWIQMNSGICDPKDVEAIEAWKKATQ